MLVTLTAGFLFLALGAAHPHHLLQPQQQAYYPGYPAVQQSPSSFYYVPQANTASVTSVQQYAAPVPLPVGVAPMAPPQYLLLYPGGGGVQHNFLHQVGRDDSAATERPTIWNLFNIFQRPSSTPRVEEADAEEVKPTSPTPTKGVPVTTTITAPTSTFITTVEETTPKSANEEPAKPEKIVGEGETTMEVEQVNAVMTDEEKAPLEDLDETVQPGNSPSPDGRQFVLMQRPQFFGNYDLLHQPDTQQRFGTPPGAISNFLLFRNGFVKPAVAPGRPLKMEADVEPEPGAAALAFQQEMRHRNAAEYRDGRLPGSQLVDLSPHALPPLIHFGPAHQTLLVLGDKGAESSPAQAVVVDAERPKKEGPGGDEAGQAGPSVAQAKPQAIALAGVGGMAAATPVATAVVGPGGLAVSAPTATAIAGGPSRGGALVGPTLDAVNKHVNKVNKVKTRDELQGQEYRDYDRYH